MPSEYISHVYREMCLSIAYSHKLTTPELWHVCSFIGYNPKNYIECHGQRLVRTRNMKEFPCSSWSLKTIFMNPQGEKYPCPILSHKPEYNLDNNDATTIKKLLAKETLCFDCHLMCDGLSYAENHTWVVAKYYLEHPTVALKLMKQIITDKRARQLFVNTLRGRE